MTIEAAFILHTLRGLGYTTTPGGPRRLRTAYLYGAAHDWATIRHQNPPPLADCSGYALWALDRIAYLDAGGPWAGLRPNSHGMLALAREADAQRPLPDSVRRVIAVEQAAWQRGALLLVADRTPGHVGISLGGAWMVDCASSAGGVRIATASTVRWSHGVWLFHPQDAGS